LQPVDRPGEQPPRSRRIVPVQGKPRRIDFDRRG
jgi:hypothetical protein